MDVMEAIKSMNDYSIKVSLATKVMSKATQALDKITNLQ